MSMGKGARAHLVLQDEQTVIYEYGGYNLNDEKFRNKNYICDGLITIQRECFLEPDIHEKIKRMPSGRKKLITKRIPVDVDITKAIQEGLIVVENCSNCWKVTEDEKKVDVMACRILFYLFKQYQVEGKMPEHMSLDT